MPENQVIEKLNELGDRITHIQAVNDRLEKDYDGLDLQNVKENAQKAADGMQDVQDIKQQILADPKGKGFYYKNLVLLNYHNEVMEDYYPITETTVFKLIIKPIVCQNHEH